MGDTAQYVQFGFLVISVANLIMIGLLVVVFALAVVLRVPGERRGDSLEPPGRAGEPSPVPGSVEGPVAP